MFKTRSSSPQLKIYITSSGNSLMAVSTMFGTGKKYKNWHFGLFRSPGNEFVRQYARL